MSEIKFYSVDGVVYLNSKAPNFDGVAYEGGDFVLYLLDSDRLSIDAYRETKLHEDDQRVTVEWVGINSNTYISYAQRCKNRGVTPMSFELFHDADFIRSGLQMNLAMKKKFAAEETFDSAAFKAMEDALQRVTRSLLLEG
jgi:hypothetical protein